MMLHLKNGSKEQIVTPEIGWTILDVAIKYELEWGFSCTRGTCARCRCRVVTGTEYLEEPTDAECKRLTEEEIASGYRLACQSVIHSSGELKVVHDPYR